MPRKIKPPHYRNGYHVKARGVREGAYANPDTRCWRCGNTLPDCAPHKDGTPARWTAGHIHDGEIDGRLLPECSPCNLSEGGRLGNARRNRTDLTW